MMPVHIEPLVSLIRVFPEGASYGEPYSWCGTLRYHNRQTAEVIGVMRAPTPDEWRAIKAALGAIGIDEVLFTRMRSGGKQQTKRIPTRKSNDTN